MHEEKWKQTHKSPKSLGWNKNYSKREDYSNTSLGKEPKNSQTNNPTLHLKELEKEKQTQH